MKKWIILTAFLAFVFQVNAQTGTAYGIKGGLALANQSWNQSEREFGFAYHGDLFLESVNDSLSIAFYVAAGYHLRGSAIVVNSFFDPRTGITFPRRRINHRFNNVAIQAGAKNFHRLKDKNIRGFYGLGLRVEYTIDYNLAYSNSEGYDLYLNRFNYGLSVLGGVEFEFKNFPGAVFLELSFHPDVSKQIFIPPGVATYTDPVTNMVFTFSEQKVFNRTLELTLGYKFIRRVEWID
ncbi:MAG: hypothetical protein AAF502_14095 [Bacteroidota bacterium]